MTKRTFLLLASLTAFSANGFSQAKPSAADENAPTNRKLTLQAVEKMEKKKAAKLETVVGTFVRIDSGDYSHWVMKDAKGEEISFFIIQDDEAVRAVLAKPEKFQNRKCKVTFKKGTENIPEAGGDITISQIVTVEWL